MSKCRIEGCTKDAYYNPVTGSSNIVCSDHFRIINNKTSGVPSKLKERPLKRGPADPKTNIRNKKFIQNEKPKVETLVLRGHTLTINYSGKTKHINVNRLTRAVKYNDDREGSSGKMFHYVLDIKQGNESVNVILYDNKKERDADFLKLQSLLSRL
jgi:hypothetical protein